jgi:hypothetical protein
MSARLLRRPDGPSANSQRFEGVLIDAQQLDDLFGLYPDAMLDKKSRPPTRLRRVV